MEVFSRYAGTLRPPTKLRKSSKASGTRKGGADVVPDEAAFWSWAESPEYQRISQDRRRAQIPWCCWRRDCRDRATAARISRGRLGRALVPVANRSPRWGDSCEPSWPLGAATCRPDRMCCEPSHFHSNRCGC
ncbi:putative uracil-DNA glycosylase [Mycobacterium xenopi 4042]|uniref:Putative uracil-DNA glycosylase n=1 Tax=Mycobacterium xenopi 4042 TaxID=1299334 RepID=X8E784_MYCXE|nr:putative uracil-DNA glycosylase [Mycobacterium xenopi 4042]